jgi:hypothetical protein
MKKSASLQRIFFFHAGAPESTRQRAQHAGAPIPRPLEVNSTSVEPLWAVFISLLGVPKDEGFLRRARRSEGRGISETR